MFSYVEANLKVAAARNSKAKYRLRDNIPKFMLKNSAKSTKIAQDNSKNRQFLEKLTSRRKNWIAWKELKYEENTDYWQKNRK